MANLTISEKYAITQILQKAEFVNAQDEVPRKTLVAMWEHALMGERSRQFVDAFLKGKFFQAFQNTDFHDAEAKESLAEMVKAVLGNFPADSYGSTESVMRWRNAGGMIGKRGLQPSSVLLTDAIVMPSGNENFLQSVVRAAKDDREIEDVLSKAHARIA